MSAITISAMALPHVYRSKVDWWLMLILLGIPASQFAIQWPNFPAGTPPTSFLISLAVLACIFVVFFPVLYVFEGDTVSIQCGLIGWEYTAFRVGEVLSVRPTYDPLAAPALSLDRLSVDLGFRGAVLISPRDKAGFLRALGALDPELRPENDALVRRT